MVTTINAEIGQGDGLAMRVIVTSPANAELADYAWMAWKYPGTPLLVARTADMTITAGADDDPDTVDIVIPGDLTALLPPGAYHHELKMLAPEVDAQPETLARGRLSLRASAIKDQVT